MKKLLLLVIIILSSCNMNNNTKKTVIFDFDDTIISTTTSTTIYSIAMNFDKSKIDKVKNKIAEANKFSAVYTYMFGDYITEILGRKQNKTDFEKASLFLKDKITKGLADTIQKLQNQGNKVMIIGGAYGTCDILVKIGADLGIVKEDIYSGISTFDSNDDFYVDNNKIGFFNCGTGQQINKNWHKSEVIKYLKQNGKTQGNVIHVGDGPNDLEVWQAGAVDAFVGFGINQSREQVKKGAPFFVENMDDFNKIIFNL